MSNRNTSVLDGPIEVGKHIYYINMREDSFTIKAENKYNSSEYFCFVSSDSIKKYRLLDAVGTLRIIIINLLVARSTDNRGLSLLCSGVKDFSIECEENSIIMKIVIKDFDRQEETITLSLKKQFNNRSDEDNYYNEDSDEDHSEDSDDKSEDCNCSQYLAKITELENIIFSMKKDIDMLKTKIEQK